MPTDAHSLQRTSPKGPGHKFVGYCTKCGKRDLTFADLNEECANPAGVTQDQALINAIRGPSHAD